MIEFYPIHTWDKLEDFLLNRSGSGNFFQDIIISEATQEVPYRCITLVGLKSKKIAELYEGADSDGRGTIAGIRLYKSDEETYQEPFSLSQTSNRKMRFAAACKNGILISFGTEDLTAAAQLGASYLCEILITTNNNMATAVFVSPYNTGSSRNTLMCENIISSSEDDDPDIIRKLTYSQVSMEQWQLIPFTTVGSQSSISYTPDAFYMQSKTFGFEPYFARFMDNDGVNYMTNGFWAVRDE